MSDGEDRTQAPSKRRLDQARERGLAPHSPDLTAAVGLLGAALAVSAFGGPLIDTLLQLVRDPFGGVVSPEGLGAVDAGAVVGRLRGLAVGLAGPLLGVLGGFWIGAVVGHQAQVRGLWAPGLLAPDFGRLWTLGQGEGPDPAAHVGRGLWALARAAVIATVAVWIVRSDASQLQSLSRLDTPALATAAAGALRHVLLSLAAATLTLGLVDFGLQYHRFQNALMLSPDQHREDSRAAEGDPVARSRRRQAARALLGDDLAGATLAVEGPGGFIAVLDGGPPPRAVTVRALANGPSARRLRKAVTSAKLPTVDDPDLARKLAQRRTPSLPLNAELLGDLARHWGSAKNANSPRT